MKYPNPASIPPSAFVEEIVRLARRAGVSVLLNIPGVYELVAEEFNNDAIHNLVDDGETTETED